MTGPTSSNATVVTVSALPLPAGAALNTSVDGVEDKLDDITTELKLQRGLTPLSGSAGTGYNGTADIVLGTGLAPGDIYYLDSCYLNGTDDGGSGSTSVTVYIFWAIGQTPGASDREALVSEAINITAGNFADTIIPNKRFGLAIPAGGCLYAKVVPDAGTIIVTAISVNLTRVP